MAPLRFAAKFDIWQPFTLFPGGGGAEAERGLLLRGHRHHDAGLLRRPLRLGHLRGVQLAQHRTLGEIARRYVNKEYQY